MSWASRRKFQYLSGVSLVLALIVFAILAPTIFKKPTCTDGKQNGNEVGIDCGGVCSLMCRSQVSPPVVLWNRAFHIIGRTHNLVAFIENRNKESGVISAQYEFKVYDTNNLLIGRVEGSTFIPPNQQFVVIEPRFDAGQSVIKSVTFDFVEPITWIKKLPTLQKEPIKITNILFDNNKDTPSLSALIKNDSIYDLPEFDVVAILYDENHNAINASKTHKDGLGSGNNLTAVFTWPEVLPSLPVTQDVLIQINPFSVSF